MINRKKTSNIHVGKKILVPLFWSYYLFDYLKFLVPKLCDDGFEVTVLTAQQEIFDIFNENEKVKTAGVPLVIRYLLSRSGRWPQNVLLWLFGWCWVLILRSRYHFSILPFDNKHLWYMLSCVMPSLTCHNTTELIDLKLTLDRDRYKGNVHPFLHKLFLGIDWLSGGRFLPRWPGQINKYFPKQLIVHRLMGYWTKNFYCGFSKIKYLTVSGHAIKANYVSMGLDQRKVFVTGNPNYDHLKDLESTFKNDRVNEFKYQLGIPNGVQIFSFFLSPSSFTDVQIEEVVTVAKEIIDRVDDAFLVLKFHPKTSKQYPERFNIVLNQIAENFLLITSYQGEVYNAKLVLASDYLVQKQCTVGFIAMLLRRKCISYNLFTTDYEDDMYRCLNASEHVESIEALRHLLDMIALGKAFGGLEEKQKEACRLYCLDDFRAIQNISDVIQSHFNGTVGAV